MEQPQPNIKATTPTKAEYLIGLGEIRAEAYQKYELLQTCISQCITIYREELETLAGIQHRLRDPNILPVDARTLRAMCGGYEWSLREVEDKVVETTEKIGLMREFLMELQTLDRKVRGEEAEEEVAEEWDGEAESDGGEDESVGDWGAGAENAVAEEDETAGTHDSHSGGGEDEVVGG